MTAVAMIANSPTKLGPTSSLQATWPTPLNTQENTHMSTSRLAVAPHVAAALLLASLLGSVGIAGRALQEARRARAETRAAHYRGLDRVLDLADKIRVCEVRLDTMTAVRHLASIETRAGRPDRHLASVTSLPTPVTAGGAR